MSASRAPTQRPPTFIGKTYLIIEDPDTNHLIQWDHDGETFTVHNPERLAVEVFPGVYNHHSYPSFTRALNAYGFRQVARNKWKHPDFRRGNVGALESIQRRRPMRKRTDPAPPEPLPQPTVDNNLQLLGFNAAGCMQLMEAHRSAIQSLQADIADLKHQVQASRAEEVRLQTHIEGVLRLLVQEYGRPAIEAALGGSLEAFMQYANAHGVHMAAHEWLQNRKLHTPRITYRGEAHEHAANLANVEIPGEGGPPCPAPDPLPSGGPGHSGRGSGVDSASGSAPRAASPGVAATGAVSELASLIQALGWEYGSGSAAGATSGAPPNNGGRAGAVGDGDGSVHCTPCLGPTASHHAAEAQGRFEEIRDSIDPAPGSSSQGSAAGAATMAGGHAKAVTAPSMGADIVMGAGNGPGPGSRTASPSKALSSPRSRDLHWTLANLDSEAGQPNKLVEMLLDALSGDGNTSPGLPRASRTNSADLFEEVTGGMEAGGGGLGPATGAPAQSQPSSGGAPAAASSDPAGEAVDHSEIISSLSLDDLAVPGQAKTGPARRNGST